MNEVANRNPSQELAEWIRHDERRAQIARALPEGVSIDRFERATATALLANPDLVKLDRTSLYLSILRAAQLGLVPDGRQCALVPFGKNATLIVMIGGVRDTLAEYGWMLKTGTVRENDDIVFDEAAGTVSHPVRIGSDRGEIVAFYAVASHRDGRQRMATQMSVAEVNEVRDKAGVANNPAWKKWYEAMGEKTVGHRLADDVPLAPQDRRRFDWVINVTELEPGESAVQLYGPQDATFSEIPSDDPPEVEGDDGPPVVTMEDEEPGPGTDGKGPGSFIPSTGKFAVGGDHGPKTLAEILALGDDGEKWLKWAMSKITSPDDYVAALWAFSEAAAPGIYQAALAAKELRA